MSWRPSKRAGWWTSNWICQNGHVPSCRERERETWHEEEDICKFSGMFFTIGWQLFIIVCGMCYDRRRSIWHLDPTVFAHHQRRSHEDLALPLLGIVAAGRAQSGTSLGTISRLIWPLLLSVAAANCNVLFIPQCSSGCPLITLIRREVFAFYFFCVTQFIDPFQEPKLPTR